MEKKSFIYYFGVFILGIFICVAISAGNWMMMDFVTEIDPTQLTNYSWIPFVGAGAFLVGYFAMLFSNENPTKTKQRLILIACFALPLIVLSLIVFRNPDHRDLRQALIAALEYFVAGEAFGWGANHFKTVVKI